MRKQLKKRGWSLQYLADQMNSKAQTPTTTSALIQLLGNSVDPDDPAPLPSNTTLMPALNKVLGVAPPPVCDPESELAQLQDRLAAIWNEMTELERKSWLTRVGLPTEIDKKS